MREELKPCPFCGGEAKPTAHLTYSWFAPVCKSCGVRGPSVRIESGSDPQKMRELMNKADALWNRRSAPVAQPVAREPTEEMYVIGAKALTALMADIEVMPDTVAVMVWKAMYDAARKEGS